MAAGDFRTFPAKQNHFLRAKLPGDIPEALVVNNPSAYYRFHGKPVLYTSEYPEEALQNLLKQLEQGIKKMFIYFNNTWGNAAIKNSRQMQELVFNGE